MTDFQAKFDAPTRQVRNLSYGTRQIKNLSYGRGFTLLEVMLALGLTLIVISAVGVSIDLYLRLYDSGRTNVEEAQLARALLRRMADDIRGTVQYAPMDVEQLTAAVSGSTSGSSSATGATSGTGDASQSNSQSGASATGANMTDTETEGTSTDDSETETLPIDDATDLASTGPQTVPGLYGNSYQLQIDVNRLPRIDQYMYAGVQGDISDPTQSMGSTSNDRVSDSRNIAYYVFGNTSAPAMGADLGMQMGCGLVRRDMDRGSSLYASQLGDTTSLDASGIIIAPEVESIQFAYYDGKNMEWLSSWDSSQNGGLPMAVQITLVIARQARKDGSIPSPGVYSLLVNLPAASIASTTDTASSDSTSSTSQDSSSSSSSSGENATTPSSNTPTTPTNNPSGGSTGGQGKNDSSQKTGGGR